MSELLVLVLVGLWLLGAFVTPVPALGSLIHVLLALALGIIIIRLVQGRRINV